MAAPDNEVIKRAVGGDRPALIELFERHAAAVRQSAATQIPRRWQSLFSEDDVMQQTYADAFRGIGDFAGTSHSVFAAWLDCLARCNLRDAIRGLEAKKRSPDGHLVRESRAEQSLIALCELLSSSGTTPSGHCARDEAKTAVRHAIEQLPKIYCTVVQMYDLKGKSVEEVAKTVNRSPGAVYMLRARAHDRLRELLGSASAFF